MAKHRTRVGLHARNDVRFPELDFESVRLASIETLKVMSFTEVGVCQRLCRENPGIELIVRLYDDRIGRSARSSPAEFVAKMVPVIMRLKPYAAKFEIHNEPNHAEGIEGWGASDDHARAFRDWYLQVLRGLKKACPWAQFGFPGLATNYPHRDLEWLEICGEAVHAADWLGCHCYWQYDNMLRDEWGLRFKLYHERFPTKRIEITEFADSTPDVSAERVAQEYVRYYQDLNKYSYLGSACAFIASSPDPNWGPFAWVREGGHRLPVVEAVGNVPRVPVEVPAPQSPEPPKEPAPTPQRTFPQTGKTVRGSFLRFFERYGLDICGYPITEQLQEAGKPAQYFQRLGLEEAEPGKIRLKPVGTEAWTSRKKIDRLMDRLEALLERSLSGSALPSVTVEDIVDRLPVHPQKRFPSRSLAEISQIVVHHTATGPTLTPQRLAQYLVGELDKPGILYHFFVAADGHLYQTNRLETAPEHAQQRSQSAVGLTFSGNFTADIPTPAQLRAGGQLCAWLLDLLCLPNDAIVGVSEFASTQSPGLQWLDGQRWKDKLLAEVEGARTGGEGAIATTPPSIHARIEAVRGEVRRLKLEPPPDLAPTSTEELTNELSDVVLSLQSQAWLLQGELGRMQATSRPQGAEQSAPDRAAGPQIEASPGEGMGPPAETEVVPSMPGEARAAPAAAWQEETAPTRPVVPAGATTLPAPGLVCKPPIKDVVDTLVRHPTDQYETRPLAQITTLVVHHSAAPAYVSAAQIANYHVKKLNWPGIGYHFVIAADGTTLQGNKLETVSHHVAASNPVSVGICFLGILTNQVPPPAQLRAGAHLLAWLMQELQIPLDQVKGHRELMQTLCPGNQWLEGQNWKRTLRQEIVRIQEEATPPTPGLKTIFHYMLFWALNGTWARQDWLNAVDYIAAFRPTVGFAPNDAAQAKYVTIVGGPAGVSPQVAQWLETQGCAVERVAGKNETETREMLNNLVREGRRFQGFDVASNHSQADQAGSDSAADAAEAKTESMLDPTQSGYQVTLPVFEGPLDLLLHLIERQELDITEVSLAQVTNQYVEYIAQLGERDPDNLADFLVVAAKLLLIKSRVLLPQPPSASLPQEEETGRDLVRQLLEYRQFKEAARKLGQMESLGLYSYIRLADTPALEPAVDLQGVTVDDLLAAVRRAMLIKPPAPSVNGTVSPVTITVAEQMQLIERETAGGRAVSFLRLLERLSSRLEIIVTLLALLEMIKQKRVAIRQEQPFADIEIVPRAASPAAEPS